MSLSFSSTRPPSRALADHAAFAAAGAWLVVLGMDACLSRGDALWAKVVGMARPHDVPGLPPVDEPAYLGEVEALALWLAGSFGVFAARCSAGGGATSGARSLLAAAVGRANGYAAVRSTAPVDASSSSSSTTTQRARKRSPPKTTRDDGAASAAASHQQLLVNARPSGTYNLFDPDALPPALRRFAGPVFASSEALGNFFGFQDDNVRNQAEHALMLLANTLAQQPPMAGTCQDADDAASLALHRKLFANYRQWCAFLETEPRFSPPAESRADAGGPAADVMLWLCVWGEAANLRHMPECCCYLYHSAAAEWASTDTRERQGDRGASLYPGHWLDTVVAPVYDVVAASMKKKADHVDKNNYDDFNEFFWSKACLRTHRSAVATATALRHRERTNDARSRSKRAELALEAGAGAALSLRDGDFSTSGRPDAFPPPVAYELEAAPKTYLEVRTWLHVVFAFQRVYEYHVLAFQVLATLAFSRYLVWDGAYALEVLSGVAVTINASALFFAVLEAFLSPPAADDVAVGALAARISGRFVCLAYQAMYLCWALDAVEAMPNGEVRALARGDNSFWFWQHVWLSCAVVGVYAVEAALQLWPYGLTLVYTSFGESDAYKAVLAVFVPRSLNYVGQAVHEPYAHARKYHVYWLSLVAWKLVFGYVFLVKPMVAPTVQICDDYLNFPAVKGRGLKTAAQLVGRWMPSCLIFLVDSSIWYSLWAAAVGTYVGFRDKLGIVRDFPALRDAFLLLPTNFCAKLVDGVRDDVGKAPVPLSPHPRAPLDASPRSSVAPELQKYFDDQHLREQEACCCGPASGPKRAASPRRLGKDTPPTSSSDLASTLGAASAFGGGALAPRLPSFLSITDALKPNEASALLPFKPDLGGTKSDTHLAKHLAGATPSPATSFDARGAPLSGEPLGKGGLRQGLLELLESGGASSGGYGDGSSGYGGEKKIDALGQADDVQWILFAEAWNDVVAAMRRSDTLNDFERDVLTFDRYAGFSKPVYLPIFVTAGAIERATALAADAAAAYRPLAKVSQDSAADDDADAATTRRHYEAATAVDDALGLALRADVVATEALDEVKELATWLVLKVTGPIHRDDLVAVVAIVDTWCRGGKDSLLDRVRVEDLQAKVLAPLAQLAALLLKGLAKRKVLAEPPAPHVAQGPVEEPPSGAAGAGKDDPAGLSGPQVLTQGGALAAADSTLTSTSTSTERVASAPLPPAPAPPGGADGMKRTQSTSGLASMAAAGSWGDLSAPAPAQTSFTPKGGSIANTRRYSLSSTKYVAAADKSRDDGPNDAFRDACRDKLRQVLQGAKACVIRGDAKRGIGGARAQELLDRLTFVLANERGFFWDGTYASSRLDSLRGDLTRATRLLSKLHNLLTTPQRKTEPRGQEATRRLTFFVNSLLMDLPPAPPLDAMVSLTTLTPFYSEDVLLSKNDLLAKNSDGVTTLLYLQTLYSADWAAFLERRGLSDSQSYTDCFNDAHVLETRLWASFRAQTLARTVEGMMQNEAALRLLARLEKVNATHQARKRKASGRGPRTSLAYNAACEESHTHPRVSLDDLLKLKFGYVVTCQIYGKQKKNEDPKAKDIELLLRRFPLLRVAYIDEQRVGRSGQVAFYSCLVKARDDDPSVGGDVARSDDGGPEEVFRVRLPGNPVIGEGKPENQNHAVVFTRGECLQTIDMNQDGFFEEALKTRNLLQEFRPGAPGVPVVAGAPPVTIVGFREHIFTGSVSSLANYMALQELSFVTLGQRVLADPLHMRLHYGHPDIFDKLWFSTRGGVSKASKGINLSEDIFAGYTSLIRGGAVVMKEYAQVGKGRDVGMQQIYKFEAKLSQGNAEQCLARDVSRVAARLDFPRLLSYYFGGIGHYINSALTIVTIQLATYLALLLAVYGAESIGHRLVVPLGTVQVLLAGLGLLNTLPLLAALTVEKGLLAASRDVAQVFASGGPLYFIFHIQTRAHYFIQTILAGGATYRATGRGFVTTHNTFDEQYRFFASSHLYLGVELAAALVLMGLHTEAGQYAGRTWSLWLACGSFLLAPFWFNPLGFSWPHVFDDFVKWQRWISYGTSGGTAADSWDVWYKEESAPTRRLSTRSKLLVGSKALLYVALAKGLSDFTGHAAARRLQAFGYAVGALVACQTLSNVTDAYAYRLNYACHRLLKMVLGVASVAVVVGDLVVKPASLKFAVSTYYLGAAVCTVGTLWGGAGPVSYSRTRAGPGFNVLNVVPLVVRHLSRFHDLAIGYCYFALFLPLSAVRVVDTIQTWLLFHNALSEGVVVEDILKQARQSQDAGSSSSADQTEELRALRRQVDLQQAAIARLLADKHVTGDIELAIPDGAVPEIASDTNITDAPRAARANSNAAARRASSYQAGGRTDSRFLGGDANAFTFNSPSAMPPRALAGDKTSTA